MTLFGWKLVRAGEAAQKITRAEAFVTYFDFMAGLTTESFSFPPGDYSPDEVVHFVHCIIDHDTADMKDRPWRERLERWQRWRPYCRRPIVPSPARGLT